MTLSKSETPEPINTKFLRLITSAISLAVPKIITIGFTGAPPHMREILRFVCLFLRSWLAHSPNGVARSSMIDQSTVSRGSAFWGHVDDLSPEGVTIH